jgi:hypothetical protein
VSFALGGNTHRMKKCIYCGREYSDDTSVCPADGKPLEVCAPPPSFSGQAIAASQVRPVSFVAYVIAGASFIPCIGVIFGIVAIVWGVARRARSLVLLGVGGILFTVVLYGALFYFGFCKRGGFYDELRSKLAVTMLNSAVKEIEYYKLQHGHYPTNVQELSTSGPNKFPTITDPTAMAHKGTNAYFYYELESAGTSYFLRSVGPDGIPFTADDIVPSISEEERKHTGLKLTR